MIKLLRLLTLIGVVLATNTAWAVRLSSLYQTTVPAVSQSADERSQAAAQALGQVLIKASGNAKILDNPAVKPILTNANSMVQEYSYTATSAPGSKPYLLQFTFDPDAVNKSLLSLGVPIWGQSRPLILVWLEYEAPNHPAEILNTDATNVIPTILKDNADRRGVPILFPTLDMTDLNQVATNDVTTMAVDTLTAGAKRYGSDGILIGRVIKDDNGFSTQWKLVIGSDHWEWTANDKTADAAIAVVMDNIADTLAARYSAVVSSAVKSQITLHVTGVTKADDFDELMQYIKHLTPVADAQIAKVNGSEVLLTINLHGAADSFTKAVSVDQRLTPVSGQDNSDQLTYQWNH